MIGLATIRFRLTATYAVIMAVMVTGTAVLSWVAARQSVAVTVDRGLERDMDLFRTSVRQVRPYHRRHGKPAATFGPSLRRQDLF